jgi:hypothetical protein
VWTQLAVLFNRWDAMYVEFLVQVYAGVDPQTATQRAILINQKLGGYTLPENVEDDVFVVYALHGVVQPAGDQTNASHQRVMPVGEEAVSVALLPNLLLLDNKCIPGKEMTAMEFKDLVKKYNTTFMV